MAGERIALCLIESPAGRLRVVLLETLDERSILVVRLLKRNRLQVGLVVIGAETVSVGLLEAGADRLAAERALPHATEAGMLATRERTGWLQRQDRKRDHCSNDPRHTGLP